MPQGATYLVPVDAAPRPRRSSAATIGAVVRSWWRKGNRAGVAIHPGGDEEGGEVLSTDPHVPASASERPAAPADSHAAPTAAAAPSTTEKAENVRSLLGDDDALRQYLAQHYGECFEGTAALDPSAFWLQIYGYVQEDNQDLAQALRILETFAVCLEVPELSDAFLATGGPSWLVHVFQCPPGPKAPGIPNEAELDAQLHHLKLHVSSSRPANNLTHRDVDGGLDDCWAVLEMDDERDERTWRLSVRTARTARGDHRSSAAPAVAGPDVAGSKAPPSNLDLGAVGQRGQGQGDEVDSTTFRSAASVPTSVPTTPSGPGEASCQGGRAASTSRVSHASDRTPPSSRLSPHPFATGSEEERGESMRPVPKLHLSSLPKDVAVAASTSRSASVLAGSVLAPLAWQPVLNRWAEGAGADVAVGAAAVDAWVDSGGSVAVSGPATALPDACKIMSDVERLVGAALRRLPDTEAVREAVATFAATSRGRAQVFGAAAAPLPADTAPLALRRDVEQLLGRCVGVSQVELKLYAVQRQRVQLQADANERRRWVQQLCCCALERSLYLAQLQRYLCISGVVGNVETPACLRTLTDRTLVVKGCCEVLRPLGDPLRFSRTSAYLHLHAPAIHYATQVIDAVLVSALDDGRASLGAAVSTLAADETATAVVSMYLEWVLSFEPCGGSPLPFVCGVGAAVHEMSLRPMPKVVAKELRRGGLRHVRRLVEVCSHIVGASPAHPGPGACGDSVRAAALLLANLHAEEVHMSLGRWFERHMAEKSVVQDATRPPADQIETDEMETDVLRTLVAMFSNTRPSDCRKLPSVGTIKLVRPVLALLRQSLQSAAADEAAAERARLCLQVILVLAMARGIGKVGEFYDSGVVQFLVAELSMTAQTNTPAVTGRSVTTGRSATALQSGRSATALASGRSTTEMRPRVPSGPMRPKPGGTSPLPSRQKSITPGLARSARSATQEPLAIETFTFGQKVRGLWTLPDGRQRWFPGDIVKVEGEDLYSVRYTDGDEQQGKHASDLRSFLRTGSLVRSSPISSTHRSLKASSSAADVIGAAVDVGPTPMTSSLPDLLLARPVPSSSLAGGDANATMQRKRAGVAADTDAPALDGAEDSDGDGSDEEGGSLGDSDDSVFVTIPSCLSPRPEAKVKNSLSLDLALVQALAPDASATELGGQTGFSSLAGFGGTPSATPSANRADAAKSPEVASWLTQDHACHELCIAILLSLALTPDGRCLERSATEAREGRLLPSLRAHFASPASAVVLPTLFMRCQVLRPASMAWLLKLLAAPLMDTSPYCIDHTTPELGVGNFGRVVSVPCPGAKLGGPARVAIKLCPGKGNRVEGIFDEVSSLMLLQRRGSGGSVRLIDFGYSAARNEHWIVMEQCRESLKAWRKNRAAGTATKADVMLYLSLFRNVARVVGGVADCGVMHLDLKCDNVLLRYDPTQEASAGISMCLADFGEACVVEAGRVASGMRLQRARGTECIQSPEMLLVHTSTTDIAEEPPSAGLPTDSEGTAESAIAVGTRRQYVSCASDVWSLGCLLFELLTGEFLYDITETEGGWARLFVMLTKSNTELFLDRKLKLLRNMPMAEHLEKLLRQLLVRDPVNRPSAKDVIKLVDTTLSKVQLGGEPPLASQMRPPSESSSPAFPPPRPPASEEQWDVMPPPLVLALETDLVWQLDDHLLVASRSSGGVSNSAIGGLEGANGGFEGEALRRPLLPAAWMEGALCFAQGNVGLRRQMAALGVTSVLRVHTGGGMLGFVDTSQEKGQGDLEQTSLCFEKGAVDGTPELPAAAIADVVKKIGHVREAGGRVLLLPAVIDCEACNEAACALAVALLMETQKTSFYDSVLTARGANATMRVSKRAFEQIQEWRRGAFD